MTRRRADRLSGLPLIALAAVLWAFIGLFTSALLDRALTATEIALWRALIAGACFAAHALARGQGRVRSLRDAGGLAAFGIVAVGLFYVALARAVELGGVSLAWILLYTAPAWVAVAAVTLLGEHVDAIRRLLIAVTVAGVVLVALGGGDGVMVSPASLGWGLAAGLAYASWYVGGKHFLPRYSPVTISAWILLVGAVVLLPLTPLRALPASAWWLLIGLGVVSTYLPALAYYSGLTTVDASRAAIVATIEPVVALLLAVLIEGERLGPLAALGGLLVLAAATTASARR